MHRYKVHAHCAFAIHAACVPQMPRTRKPQGPGRGLTWLTPVLICSTGSCACLHALLPSMEGQQGTPGARGLIAMCAGVHTEPVALTPKAVYKPTLPNQVGVLWRRSTRRAASCLSASSRRGGCQRPRRAFSSSSSSPASRTATKRRAPPPLPLPESVALGLGVGTGQRPEPLCPGSCDVRCLRWASAVT